MSFSSAVATILMGFILREAPTLKDKPDALAKYNQDVNQLVDIHDEVSDGGLVNHDMDVLILSAVNYRESRLRNPTVDGDCHKIADGIGALPSGSWPKGFVPTYHQTCNAVGPMQISKGSVHNLGSWAEVREEFEDRAWEQPSAAFKLADLRDAKTNVRIAYAELKHWKNECQVGGVDAPVGVWFTAYRYGHCPAKQRSGKFYIDGEAKTRCELVTKMVKSLSDDASGLPALRCVY